MQLDFFLRPSRPDRQQEVLSIDGNNLPVHLFANHRARRYILRVKADGLVQVTIPRGGSRRAAMDFARRHTAWVAQQLQKRPAQNHRPTEWRHGVEILFRGERVALTVEAARVQFADQVVSIPEATGDARPALEAHLWQLATDELARRTFELAELHELTVRRVTVRNQRSRWGSCSRHGTISLNWRLIQTPALVRDYIILHELMHLREMNHSARFWRWVEHVCPQYAEAERWLKAHADLLR